MNKTRLTGRQSPELSSHARRSFAIIELSARSCPPLSLSLISLLGQLYHLGRICFRVLHPPCSTHAPRHQPQYSPATPSTLPRPHSERSTRRCVANNLPKKAYPRLPFWITIRSGKPSSCRRLLRSPKNETPHIAKTPAGGLL